MTSRSRRRQEQQRRDPAPAPRRRWHAWIGVLLQPVAVVGVLIAHGMLVDPYPPRPEWPMLLPIGVLALLGLVPVLVQSARSGGPWEVGMGLVAWGFAQSGTGLVGALLVRAIAGQAWMSEAMVAPLLGLVAAFVLLVGYVVVLGCALLVAAVRESRAAKGIAGWGLVLISAGVGGALLGAVALGAGGSLAESAPTGYRRLGALLASATWAFVTDERGAGVVAAQVGAVLAVGGLLAVLGGIALLACGLRSDRPAEP